MKHFVMGLILIMFGLTLPAQARMGIFYQPQLRDVSLGETRWDQIMRELKKEGFDTLIVQWTRYGEAFAKPQERDWLAGRLKRARAMGLNLVLGLYADPAFFERQSQSSGELEQYLKQQQQNNLNQAGEWLSLLGRDRIVGWYIPDELDDFNWREPERQALLARYLGRTVDALHEQSKVPAYISTFFTGKMSPHAYRDWLSSLGASGVKLMVQDGSGTGVLSPSERAIYFAILEPCEGRVEGVVHEIFIQLHGSDTFKAVPLDEAQQRVLRLSSSQCGRQRWFFSLRYLPGMEDMR